MQPLRRSIGWLTLALLVGCARAPIAATSNPPTATDKPARSGTPTPAIPSPVVTFAPTLMHPGTTTPARPPESADETPPTGLIVFEGYDGSGWGIYSIGLDGTSLTRLTAESISATSPTLSLDGQWIAYRDVTDVTSLDTHLYVMHANGTNPRRITQLPGNKIRPRVSADGSLVVYEVNADVCLAHVDTLEDSCLTDDSDDDEAPVLSPDGRQILFISDRGESRAIYSVNSDGSNLTRLVDGFSLSPAFSRDGTRIVYVRTDEGGYREIHTMNPDGSADVRPTFDSQTGFRREDNPRFSPDGSKIVFTVRTAFDGDIWIMNADGSEQTQLTFGYVDDAFPMFCFGGRRIVYWSYGKEDPALYSMKLDGSEQRRLTFGLQVGLVFPGYTYDCN